MSYQAYNVSPSRPYIKIRWGLYYFMMMVNIYIIHQLESPRWDGLLNGGLIVTK
jgi:intracellular septation protein A